MHKRNFWDNLRYLFRRQKNFEYSVPSPSERLVLKFIIDQSGLFYEVKKDNKTLFRRSRLGLKLKDETPLEKNFSLVRLRNKSENETWETAWGEEKEIVNHYNETAFYLAETSGKKRLLTLRFRVFNDGFAFRYEIQPQPKFQKLIITDEETEFNVDYNSYAWQIPAFEPDRYEYNYEKTNVYNLKKPVHTPLTLLSPTGDYLSIHEAALYDYGEMTLKLNEKNVLAADIAPLSDGAKAYVSLPWQTPWRLVMVADSAIGLTTNRIMLNLNDPPRGDFSWVKPLKFIGIWWAMYVGEWTWASGERHGATTAHAKEYIDAAKRLGVDGLLIEGWNNGWDGDWLKNGATSDFIHPQPDFNLDEVAEYAKNNHIELIGHHETVGFVDNYERQLEAAYQYYAKHHVRYVKPGYAGSMMVIQGRREWHHSQLGVKHYQKALELAAKYHISLDVHEPIKGTGIERTWPNLLTREGARGQEYEGGALDPSHACILPFTRLLSGGMDYTSGIFDVTNQNKRMATTLARQLAYYVTIFSGMQMAADRPRFYEEVNKPAFKFIHDVPVSWAKTVPLLGEIGVSYAVARKDRDSEDWYIGGVTNGDGRRVRLSLDFLDTGGYTAEIYRDGDGAHYRDNQLSLIIESRAVTKNDFLDLYMAPGGGFAIRLKKAY